jgi:putative glycosyltransferase (TIGR04372 family)
MHENKWINGMSIVKFVKGETPKNQMAELVSILKVALIKIYKLPFYILAIFSVLVIRMIKPWFLVRVGLLNSSRIGHFAANTELYLCERSAGINIPNRRYMDIFFLEYETLCNRQLLIMWKRKLRIWPTSFFAPIFRINRLLPNAQLHEVFFHSAGRDVYNLYDQFPAHLSFTTEEVARGESCMLAMGLPMDKPFICLIVRDNAYHSNSFYAYHSYRDSDINNFVLAAEACAELGYYVIRMGAKVNASMRSAHPKIIDYANNGSRSDFMDIFLGANCHFAISTGTGWDAIPEIFRRPVVYVNFVPVGHLCTFRTSTLSIVKHHLDVKGAFEINLREIFSRGVGFCMRSSDYEAKDVELVENTPEEIRDVAIEMVERLAGSWKPQQDDEHLQKLFWEGFQTYAVEANLAEPLHGKVYSRFGAKFLRDNKPWLH